MYGVRKHALRKSGSGTVIGLLAAGMALSVLARPAISDAGSQRLNGKIAFVSVRDGNREIYVMNADGSAQTNLTNSVADDADPAWSPDGTKLAFDSNRGGNFDLYLMNADGSGVTQLTVDGGANGSPSWSPDGSRLVFTSDRGGLQHIYTMNADGSGVTPLTSDLASDFEPRWSPDGTRIAFSSDRANDGARDIYVMNADGANVTRVTFNPGDSYGPDWSSDSGKLLFWNRSATDAEVWQVNADGTGAIDLSVDPADDITPVWSPDNVKVAFSSNRSGSFGICVMGADGSGVGCLTNGGDSNPSWAPLSAQPATPVISWANPADLIYGTPLSTTELNATANVPGTFSYSPPVGTVLPAGAGQTLSATFTPSDAASYTAVTATVRINVLAAPVVVTWENPSTVVYGTPLSSSQLNATANVPGTFVYSPPLGILLPVGAGQTLSVKVIPADPVNYAAATTTVTIDVEAAGPTPQPTFQVLHNFSGADGANPIAALLEDSSGYLLGTTSYSGPGGVGTIYRMDSDGAVTTQHAFAWGDGAFPTAGLVPDGDDFLYGTTSYGTVYRIATSGALSSLHSFNWYDGAHPYAGLIRATDGFFYGTTPSGGTGDNGVVFRTDADGNTTVVHAFTGPDGAAPYGALMQANDGLIYGTTSAGGAQGLGTVFRVDLNGTLTVLHEFQWTDGAVPYAGLVQATDGFFYGTTYLGPTSCGVVYRMDAAGSVTLLHAFSWSDGAYPYAAPIEGRDGFFYGATSNGGPGGGGTVYRMDASGNVTTLHAFAKSDGSSPSSALMQAQDDAFYGTTYGGGAQDMGTVFRMTMTPGDTAAQLLVSDASAGYGTAALMSASLSAAGLPLTGDEVRFAVDGIVLGTAFTDANGQATANVPLSAVHAGAHTIQAIFNGDAVHAAANGIGQLIVTAATPSVVWGPLADIYYGTALGGQQLKATASVRGKFVYSPAAGTVLTAGAQSLSVVFQPTDATDYTTVTATTSINVLKSTPQITWANPSDITSDVALGAVQLAATTSVAGTWTYVPAAGTMLAVGANQTLTVVFTPADLADYVVATASTSINVVEGETISGVAQLDWDQVIDDGTDPGSLQFALYVDGTRIELTTVSCSESTSPTDLICGAQLPGIQSGSHTLQIGTFRLNGTAVLESARSAPLFVIVPAQNPAPQDH